MILFSFLYGRYASIPAVGCRMILIVTWLDWYDWNVCVLKKLTRPWLLRDWLCSSFSK